MVMRGEFVFDKDEFSLRISVKLSRKQIDRIPTEVGRSDLYFDGSASRISGGMDQSISISMG